MEQLIGATTQSWKQVETLDEAKRLVDVGSLIQWADVRRFRKLVTDEEFVEFIRHMAARLCERIEDRLALEIVIETLLITLAHAYEERFVQAFLEALLENGERSEACLKLVEISLTAEPSDSNNDEEVFAMAVSLVCELGIALRQLELDYPGQIDRAGAILGHISTYLLSVSNSNNNCIRFSLLNYFGTMEQQDKQKIGFNKIMGRFGHTVLDQLFTLLFRKKSEAIALQYLLENTPFILEGDMHSQRIIHETWKFYMLKKPQRFGLFVQTFARYLNAMAPEDSLEIRRVYCKHLGALINVASEVNHRGLARELALALIQFKDQDQCRFVYDEILKAPLLRREFRDLLVQMRDAESSAKVIESAARFSAVKRGRRPSFQNAHGTLTMNQVQFLGHQPLTAKAS